MEFEFTPANEILLEQLNASDQCVSVIKSHSYIERILNAIINESLSEGFSGEIARASFPLKVELAIGLRLVHKEDGPVLKKLNNIRNRFAHDYGAVFDDNDADNLFNLTTKRHRLDGRNLNEFSNAAEFLRHTIAVMAIFLKLHLERVKRGKIENEVLAELVAEALDPAKRRPGMPQDVEEEFSIRVSEREAQLRASAKQ